jgi:hypothetical protein
MIPEVQASMKFCAQAGKRDGVKRVKGRECITHKHMTLKMMTIPKWKIFAMPRAKHRKMHSTPILDKEAA